MSDLPVCGYCGGPVVTCPHLYYLSQIVSVPPSADAVTGPTLPVSLAGQSADVAASGSGHQERKEGER